MQYKKAKYLEDVFIYIFYNMSTLHFFALLFVLVFNHFQCDIRMWCYNASSENFILNEKKEKKKFLKFYYHSVSSKKKEKFFFFFNFIFYFFRLTILFGWSILTSPWGWFNKKEKIKHCHIIIYESTHPLNILSFIYIYIYIYIHIHQPIDIMVSVHQWSGRPMFNPSRVIPKTQKICTWCLLV